MALQEEETNGLYCEEEAFEEGYASCIDDGSEIQDPNVKKESSFSFTFLQQDLFWEDSELLSLISKEKETHLAFDDVAANESLVVARRDAIEWILRVKARYGFSALTSVLAVNYFDRFILSFKPQSDKPWMGQLAAVACLSLAAKVEETQVPVLVDLQVEESKFVFEPKTIKRMELLVLSTLQWRMNPVTPICFFDHIIRRLGLKTHLHWEFLRTCECMLLSVITDSRIMSYHPSILATAMILHAIKEIEPCNQVEYQNELLAVLKLNEDKVEECYKLISEPSGCHNVSCKRKHPYTASSPSGVIDAIFSCDSLNGSWAMASPASSSSTSCFKRSRTQDQQMQLPSLNRMFVDVLSSPH
uniref:B-like cyclin n=1 Tax=Rhizophora mucronata TaxID=61149 RepID=A0A2P2K2M7_RHIMU